MEFEVVKLSNGVKLVHSYRPLNTVAHFGVYVSAGSRDEKQSQHGLAHFTEHCLFKGTSKRKSYHILNRMDSVGGELDAFTTKEETCIYSSFLSEHYERSIELISDLLLHSTFPEQELEKEKTVVIDEINSYLDNPYEQIYDDFEQLLFNTHPIGRGILGTSHNIERFKKKDVEEFAKKHYGPENLTISSVGNISLNKLVRILEKYFNQPSQDKKKNLRKAFKDFKRERKTIKKGTNQAHLVLGTIAYPAGHELSNAMVLMNNIIGGPAMNNRLNMNIREKHGFTYQIESSYSSYSDTGIFHIYAGADHSKIDRTKSLIERELRLFAKQPLSSHQLLKAKKQFMGQIAMARDNACNQMLAYGKSLANRGEVDTIEKIHKKIEAITAEQMHKASNEILNLSNFSELRYI